MTQGHMAMRIAHQALQRNTLRSTLTMLGVIIGVAAVICTPSATNEQTILSISSTCVA